MGSAVWRTTPGNMFHLLRRQMKRDFRKPLIVFTPKSLLRHPKAVSSINDLASGTFEEVIDDTIAPKNVEKLVFCTGKFYYDLLAKRDELDTTNVAPLKTMFGRKKNQKTWVLGVICYNE